MYKTNDSLLEDFELVRGNSFGPIFLTTGNDEILDANWKCTLCIMDEDLTEIKLQRDVPKTVDSKYFKLFLTPDESINLLPKTYKFLVQVSNDALKYKKEIINCYMKVSKNLF